MNAQVPFKDTFRDDRRRGKVVDSRTPAGVIRDGIDVEKVLSIDHGALRIQPLIDAGWGRACLSYGPFDRRAGLALSVSMVNCHNTSQAEQLPDTLKDRLNRWLVGSETSRTRRRLWRWAATGRITRAIRQFRWWARTAKGRPAVDRLDENLAVGWFPDRVSDPMQRGSAFIMHATGPENGELWRRTGTGLVPVIRSVQNLPIYYVVALRPDSAVYYAASLPGAHGLSAYPALRPLGIDACGDGDDKVWASVHQSVLGQIGFRLDTRVQGIAVAHEPQWEPWHGGAHVADRFQGSGQVAGSGGAVGPEWIPINGALLRSEHGAVPRDGMGAVRVQPTAASGLIRCIVCLQGAGAKAAKLVWRMLDDANRWEIVLANGRVELALLVDGEREVVESQDHSEPGDIDLQIVDDGVAMAFSLDGRPLFGRLIGDDRHGQSAGLAIVLEGAAEDGPCIRLFEAHPRSIGLPKELDFGAPWYRLGERTVIEDDFAGEAGPLEGTYTSLGQKVWRRIFGIGAFERTGEQSARIKADRSQPCPGRTMYAVDWDQPDFTDLEVTITPPGSARGQRENGLAGFVIWQDEDNYITVNSWVCDGYAGASISCFFNIRGWEDIYDAIWTNVGSRVQHGKPYRLRLVCDGLRYIVFVDGEPVVFRSLTDVYPDCTPLKICRVGIIANWEWGRDTGSVFRDFRGKV